MKWCISPTSLTLSCVLLSWVCAPAVRSQVTSDGTLPVPTQVDPPNGPNFNIDGGTQAGGNLFHSFREFSLINGQAAIFNNAADVQNIFSRVTGGNLSNIDGLIQAQGTANLFLLNPAGIIFGANARLEIGGSFFGSTADSVVFQDGFTFSATNTNTPPLLTINVPIGLQFGATPGDIEVQGDGIPNRASLPFNATTEQLRLRELDFQQALLANPTGLRVTPGKTFGLIGGNLTFSRSLIQAPEGRIELGSVGAGSRVNINTPDTFALNYEGVQNFQDIGMTERTGIFASGERGGDIQVQGRNLALTGESEITTLTVGAQAGGALTVNASETISLVEGTNFFVSGTFGSGNSGNVTINANTSILLRDGSQIGAATRGAGRAGDITLTTGQLILQEGSRVDSFTTEIADNPRNHAGNITVTASQSAEFNGTSADGQISGGLFARTEGTGNAGQVMIMTPSLRILNGAMVAAFTNLNSTGNAGNITVDADFIELSGNSPSGGISRLTAVTDGLGNAGKVTIDTRQLLIQDGGEVSAFTTSNSPGNAGTIKIDAEESVTISGISSTGINSSLIAITRGTGRAGDVEITTPQFIARDGGQVETLTAGSTTQTNADGSRVNRAGDITITASESVELSGKADFTGPITDEDILNSGLFASTEGTGDAGNITINTPKLTVRDEAAVVASTESTGNAGNITVKPPEEIEPELIELTGDGGLVAKTTGEGSAGNVTLTTGEFVAEDGGFVATFTDGFTTRTNENGEILNRAGNIEVTAFESVNLRDEGSGFLAGTFGSGDAGDVRIYSPRLRVRDEAGIFAASVGLRENETVGEPGYIFVQSDRIRLSDGGQIIAISQTGQGGEIALDSTDIKIERNSLVHAYGATSDVDNDGEIIIAADRLILSRDESAVVTSARNPLSGRNLFLLPQDPDVLATGLFVCNSCIIGASGTFFRFFYLPKIAINNPIPIDVDSLIRDDVCEVGVGSEFIIPGSGGIPPSPLEPLSGSGVVALDWVESPEEEARNLEAEDLEADVPDYEPLVEAQGWVVAENGQILLVAESPTVTPAVPALNRIDCTHE